MPKGGVRHMCAIAPQLLSVMDLASIGFDVR